MFNDILEAIKTFIIYIKSTEAKFATCLFCPLFMKIAPYKFHGVDLTICHKIMVYVFILALFLLLIDIAIWISNKFNHIKYQCGKNEEKTEFFEKLNTLDKNSLSILSWFYTQNKTSIEWGMFRSEDILQRLFELNLVYMGQFHHLRLCQSNYLVYLREYFNNAPITYTSQLL